MDDYEYGTLVEWC